MVNDHGDVVALADLSGEVFARYAYGPFGEDEGVSVRATDALPLALATEVASANPLRYAGYCYDTWSGHYYLQARYYDPQTKQFLSKDPATADGEESAYQYCAGDPIHKVDPTGLWGWGGLGRAFSAVKKRVAASPVYKAAARVWNASPAAKVAKRVVKAAKSAGTAIKAKAAAARNWAVDQANRAKVRLAAAKQAAEKRVARERAKRARREAAVARRKAAVAKGPKTKTSWGATVAAAAPVAGSGSGGGQSSAAEPAPKQDLWDTMDSNSPYSVGKPALSFAIAAGFAEGGAIMATGAYIAVVGTGVAASVIGGVFIVGGALVVLGAYHIVEAVAPSRLDPFRPGSSESDEGD